MAERAHDRLSRLLGLVPYLTRRPGTDLADVAAHFDVTAEQIVDDLELLFVTGRPGHMPDDLIEAEWEGGRVYVGNADEVSVPVRLSPHEVGGLLLALDYLESAHEADPTTIRAVRQKLQGAAGEGSGGILDISPPRLPEELAATVRAALREGTALHIRYYVPARDELTERTIRPLRLRLGRVWYLDAHCLTSGGDRSFAVDRIRAATPARGAAVGSDTGRPGDSRTAPADAEAPGASVPGPPQSAAAGQAAAEHAGASVTLRPESAWLADEIDVAAAGGTRRDDEHGAGTVSLDLPHVGRDWTVRLLSAHGGGVLAADPPEVVRLAADVTHEALTLYTRRTPED